MSTANAPQPYVMLLRLGGTLRVWKPNVDNVVFRGTVVISKKSEKMSMNYDDTSIEFPRNTVQWNFKHHKLRSTNAQGRTIVIAFLDGTKVQFTVPIEGHLDPGIAAVTFFKRARK